MKSISYKLDVIKLGIFFTSIAFLLIAITYFFSTFSEKNNYSWKDNFEMQKELKIAKDECTQMAMKWNIAFDTISRAVFTHFNEESGKCYAALLYQSKEEPKSAYFSIMDVLQEKELARLQFGCTSPSCMSKEEYLDVEENIFGKKERIRTEEAIPGWEEEFGMAP